MTHPHKTRICLALSIVLAVAIGALRANSAPVTTYGVQSGPARSGGISSATVSTNAPAAAPVRYTNWSMLRSDDAGLSIESPLVIPAKEIDVAATNQIIEDLSIMGRIIEKNVLTAYGVRPPEWADIFAGGYPGQNAGPGVLFAPPGRPKPLYVGGYGATFFIQVNFPLLPPAEEVKEEPARSEEDPVWDQTKRSLLESGAARAEPAGQPYSQGKVESFRRSLIAAMKHGANIRALEPGERLVFVVQGFGSPAANSGQAPAAGMALPAPRTTSPGRSVLTLRATKADVDAYAKGQLSPEQFEQRVQAITY
jgi:hypothetical protein